MGNILGHLKPELVWKHFEEFCNHPRCSKKEEKIAEYVVSVGNRLNLETVKDAFGNIVIRKPATKGKENLKTVVLQCHIDMVCEKNRDVEHDFDNDPIQPVIDGEWVRAKGTTLGADNGIGAAAALAVLEDNTLEHGPVECLFTLDEETGLTGANSLDPNILKADILLNLDSEEIGTFFIGCAGGKNTQAKFKFKKEKAEGIGFDLKVAGLKGGHSGLEIHQGLGNAVKILTRLLWTAQDTFQLRLASLEGGNKHNAIPREAFAKVIVAKDKEKQFTDYVNSFNLTVQEEYAAVDNGLQVSLERIDTVKEVLPLDLQQRLLNALYAVPHGVIKMSKDIQGLVETSTNLAVITTSDSEINIVTSQRSSVASENADIVNMVSSVFKLAGAEITYGDGYPGWKPNVDSPVLKVVKKLYQDKYNKEPHVTAIHAGLECGIINEKYPNMDMISFGPTMFGVHSPDERLKIDTVPVFWEQLTEILRNIPSKN